MRRLAPSCALNRVPTTPAPGGRMQWRLVMELSGTDGAVQVHSGGNGASRGISAQPLGLTLAEAKAVLACLQRHLIQGLKAQPCENVR